MSTIQDDILDRIRGQDRGKVFTPKDFLDLGSRDAADQSLSRLVKERRDSAARARSLSLSPSERAARHPHRPGPGRNRRGVGPADGQPGASFRSGGGQPTGAIDPGAGQTGVPDGRADPPGADRRHGVPDSARGPERVAGGEPDQCDGVPGAAASRANGRGRTGGRAPAAGCRRTSGRSFSGMRGTRRTGSRPSSAKSFRTRRSW